MNESYPTVDDLNKELTRINRALTAYSTDDPLPIREVFSLHNAIVLAGRKERESIESWAYNPIRVKNAPPTLFDQMGLDVQKEHFGLNVVWVNADSYFDIVFSAPRLDKTK